MSLATAWRLPWWRDGKGKWKYREQGIVAGRNEFITCNVEKATAGPSTASAAADFAPHDIGWFSFVVSHLSGKNKNAAKVGHPGLVIRCHFRPQLAARAVGR
jgi:hypothetical protein